MYDIMYNMKFFFSTLAVIHHIIINIKIKILINSFISNYYKVCIEKF